MFLIFLIMGLSVGKRFSSLRFRLALFNQTLAGYAGPKGRLDVSQSEFFVQAYLQGTVANFVPLPRKGIATRVIT
jgi:hypothetical protein